MSRCRSKMVNSCVTGRSLGLVPRSHGYGTRAVTRLPMPKPYCGRTTAQVRRRPVAHSPRRHALHVAGRVTELSFALAVSHSSRALGMTAAARTLMSAGLVLAGLILPGAACGRTGPRSGAAPSICCPVGEFSQFSGVPLKGHDPEAIPRFWQGEHDELCPKWCL